MSNDSMNLNLERLNRLNEKLNNVSIQKYNLISKIILLIIILKLLLNIIKNNYRQHQTP